MIAKLLSLVGGLNIWVWVAAGAAILVGTNGYTALKVHDYVEAKYQSVLLKQEVRIVEKEKKVLVLDQETLTAAITRTEQRVRQQLEDERKLEETFRSNPTLESGVCLADDELRLWNSQNASPIIYNDTGERISPEELQHGLSSGEIRLPR